MAYYFKPSAVKDLKKLPRSIRERILHKLDFYAKSTHPLLFAKIIKNAENIVSVSETIVLFLTGILGVRK